MENAEFLSISKEWVMPLEGEIVALKDIPDMAFASGIMGAGFGINPTGGQVVSPVAGTITAVFPTKHAICIETGNGQEILLHVGVDTIALEGEGFEVLVDEGARVQAGTPLIAVDWRVVQAKATSIISPVIFTNIDGGEMVEVQNGKPVLIG